MEPTPDFMRDLVDDCVHCGFCLPTCPTYALWGEEMDSPRGRIHLMKQHLDGEPLTPAMVEHFDRCLGCMACVPACPSGVQYNRLIEETRAEVEEQRRPTLLTQAIFATFPYPRRLRALRGPLRAFQATRANRAIRPLLRRISPALAAMERLAPPLGASRRLPERVAARGERRATVAMLTGCVQGAFFPGVNAATARVLAMEGCDVLIPRAQGCCGALSLHAGRREEARRFAESLIEVFAEADVIVVNSAGCGSAMKEYATVVGGDAGGRGEAAGRGVGAGGGEAARPGETAGLREAAEPGEAAGLAEAARRTAGKTRDIAEFLAELGPRATRHPLPITVAYHDACHLANAQGVRAQPRELLRGIPELRLTEIAEPEICCGSAGVYNLLQPVAAEELGDRKAANVAATAAELLVAANPGCSLQIAAALERAGRSIAVAHTVEVLDASLRGLPSVGAR